MWFQFLSGVIKTWSYPKQFGTSPRLCAIQYIVPMSKHVVLTRHICSGKMHQRQRLFQAFGFQGPCTKAWWERVSDTHSSCWCYTKTKHNWSGQCSLWRKGCLEQLERRLWCPPTPADKCGRCCRARVTKPPAYHWPAPTMTECCLAWILLWWLHLSLLVL